MTLVKKPCHHDACEKTLQCVYITCPVWAALLVYVAFPSFIRVIVLLLSQHTTLALAESFLVWYLKWSVLNFRRYEQICTKERTNLLWRNALMQTFWVQL
ncbi:hypothetical protein DVH24_031943 [Malus domestica]|uniref:Uncharacterized protein n=1 Tax=Malus domestica TaxID=3750 RepID=A0A498J337_MALDO|nr:hypothetical protein DVH24_031943 [Malus domestica]